MTDEFTDEFFYYLSIAIKLIKQVFDSIIQSQILYFLKTVVIPFIKFIKHKIIEDEDKHELVLEKLKYINSRLSCNDLTIQELNDLYLEIVLIYAD